MCFSATASFTGAALLTSIGIATWKKNKQTKYQYLAMIPFLFGIQQLSEGILWLGLKNEYLNWPSAIVSLATYSFIFFAFLVWPFWISFALSKAENDPVRHSILSVMALAGAALALIFIYYGLQSPVLATIAHKHIVYEGDAPKLYLPYFALTLLPYFISSVPRMWMLGVLFTASCVIASYVYYEAFTSTWCFFAAIISLGFYFVLNYAREEEGEAARVSENKKGI